MNDLDRALAFYRAVFGLTDTPIYEEEVRTAVLLPSEKENRVPGVSLVQSPSHVPGSTGAQVNFHVGTHESLETAIRMSADHGGAALNAVVDTGDGVRFVTLKDCEGNLFAISSFEPLSND